MIFTGRLDTNELKFVLGAATAMVFVPFFEGFGIPIVEAMYAGVPVIASNTTSIPEVAGEAALYVDPASVEEIAEAMEAGDAGSIRLQRLGFAHVGQMKEVGAKFGVTRERIRQIEQKSLQILRNPNRRKPQAAMAHAR